MNSTINHELIHFDWFDHSVFITMLFISGLIGIYYGFWVKRNNTTSEYLLGGKNMKIFPVAMSLISSNISGVTLLCMPAEVYIYGTQYWSALFGLILMTITCGKLFLPVYYRLQLDSLYQYLEIRFNEKVRKLGSFLFIICTLLNIPIVIYLPALAFNQVTGVNIHLVTPIVCFVCIFYTSLGGMKAVVWTDALQTVFMLGSTIIVVIIGTISVGGLDIIWQRSYDSGRIEFFNLNPDPTIRHTFWNVVFGVYFSWLASVAVHQGMVQRFLALPSITKAKGTLVIYCIGVFVIVSVCCFTGLLIYATYYDCDLITKNIVHASDQLVPYFVMDKVGFIPGLPGLFIAGVFSAALSSMSTGLNSMAGVLYEDFIKPCLKTQLSERKANLVMKIICVIMGIFCVAMVFAIENMGALFQVYGSLGGVTSGPILGIFVLGLFFPWANSMGAFVGGISGLIFMGWISFGTQIAIANKQITFPKKPVSIVGCSNLTEISLLTTEIPFVMKDEPLGIYRLSYTLYALTGLTVVLCVGLCVSFLTGPQNIDELDPDLMTPPVRYYLLKRQKNEAKRRSAVAEPLLK